MTTKASGLVDVYVYIAVFSFFFFVLSKLLAIAREQYEKDPPAVKQDDFVKQYGYSYDFTFVFRVYDEVEKEALSKTQRKFSMKKVICFLQAAGLETQCFYSCQRDEIYVKIRADQKRLRIEADRINYMLKLNYDRLRTKIQTGKAGVWAKVDITDNFNVSIYKPYQYIYAEFKPTPDIIQVYETYPVYGSDSKTDLFRGVDRIKLIISIMEAKKYEGGAGLHISMLLVKKAVLAAFPLHEYNELNSLQRDWLLFFQLPSKMPIEKIKDYFGERLGLYFVFMGYSATKLMFPAVFGLASYIIAKVSGEIESPVMPVFAVVMVLWSTFFIEFWKQTQITTAMKWGVIGYEQQERDRPQFEGLRIKSPINGEDILYFREDEKAKRQYLVMVAVCFCIMVVFIVVGSTFILQYWMNLPANVKLFTILGFNISTVITPLINSIVIAILNVAYNGVVYKLNNYENHQTDTAYEDNLVAKVFVFQLVNSFAALTYVSFVKSFLGISCTYQMCTYDVGTTLSTVFLTRLVAQVILEVFIKKLLEYYKSMKETEGLEPGVYPSPIEEQYVLNEYDALVGSLKDYTALIIQYGYCLLFVAAFPLAPTLAYAMTYLKIRIDGWKLCQAHRRPIPKSAEDIGKWEDMIAVLSNLAIMSNFGLIFFTAKYCVNIQWQMRWIMFILCEHSVFALREALALIIDDEPDDVRMQRDRNEFFVSKVMDNKPDDIVEDLFSADNVGDNVNILIDDTDLDYIVDRGNEKGKTAKGGDYEMTAIDTD